MEYIRQYSIFLILFSLLPGSAISESRWYADAGLQYSPISINGNGDEFRLVMGRASAGRWLHKEDIGMDIILGTTLMDDTAHTLQLEIPYLAAMALRLQTPDEFGIKAYTLLGYSHFKLQGNLAGSRFPGETTFSGPMVALGFMDLLPWQLKSSITLEFAGYFGHKDLDFGGLTLGLRYGY